ncbi:MAG TPA: hypothetical protein V6D17_08885, partial [Candidatus Obscuribacterales bacterium]
MTKASNADDWYLSDRSDFRSGVEEIDTQSGKKCVYLKSVAPRPKSFGFLSKSIPPDEYLGGRLRFSSFVKTQLPEGASAQLWLRVDGDWKEKHECFDNMYESRIKGTTEWTQYAVAV